MNNKVVEHNKWVKPLKRSQRVRLRKELERQKKEENSKLKETNG